MTTIVDRAQELIIPEIKRAGSLTFIIYTFLSENLSRIAYSLLSVHIFSMALLGYAELFGFISFFATIPGLIAVPLTSWHIVRKLDRYIKQIINRDSAASSVMIVVGILLIGWIPSSFHFLGSLSLYAIARLLEILTIVISIAVMSGIVLIALGLADLIYLFTNQFHRFSHKLIILLVVTGFGTFFWLTFIGLQVNSVLQWAVSRGHLDVYLNGLEGISKFSGIYVQGIAGALSLELPFLIILAWRFGNRSTEGISQISDGFQRVKNGDYKTKIMVSKNDEIGEIQKGFNEMIEAADEKRFLEATFGKYVSPLVLEAIRSKGNPEMLRGERKTGTVIFTDICGFTAMSSSMSPEQVVAILNTFMSLMIDVIHKHDGYINKFIGDAIMILFNIPVEQSFHVEKALACTADMQRNLAEANKKGLFHEAGSLSISAGINTGHMVMGNLGNESQMEFTVIGDTVNVASRACSHAGAGEIVITESMYRELKNRNKNFRLKPRTVSVKGKGKMIFYSIKSESRLLDFYLNGPEKIS